jgi:hypothetical protein
VIDLKKKKKNQESRASKRSRKSNQERKTNARPLRILVNVLEVFYDKLLSKTDQSYL